MFETVTPPTTMIYHRKTEEIECLCGKIIDGSHKCDEKPPVIICFEECENNCARCKRFTERERFESQWSMDRDGYCVCSSCYEKCHYGELPKGCECDIDSDRE